MGGTGGSVSQSKSGRRALCICIVILLLLSGITALTVWLVYRPQKPRFTVVGVAVFNLNTTSPPFLSTTMQFSVVTTNPNKRVSIFYDHLSAFVSYHNQMITRPVMLPSLFHEKHSTVQLAPILGGGGGVPVSPEVSYGLGMDQEAGYGVVALRLTLLGKLRWKAGAITTGRYGVYVKCDMVLRLSKGFVGQVPLVASPVCRVDI
ncbi:late embryogenesis abundant (LEA) hydroxyproline-rich glycoprotein family [Actinidia rufa]|uniref:Late embryogenesis abundant (LEA) hydroxyproline-rich glycoprotein family n=1 Tax=Actinidia rufa TaxID=165716 RepID=A0A7J0E6K7_9ERIC|nr:late embryogenesis abundant (LEA) hydroxyproline-rich glycoprotein family [Actinidia rufa]